MHKNIWGRILTFALFCITLQFDTFAQVPASHTYKVIIIGAGIAGLEAAHHLQEHGETNYVILEARDRIGGRAWTVQLQDNVNVDLGAAWIHGASEKNPMMILAKKWDIATIATDPDSYTLYNPDGTETSEAADTYYDQLYKQFLAAMEKDREGGDKNSSLSVSDAAVSFIKTKKLNKNAQQGLLYSISDNIEDNYAADIKDLSLFWYNNDESFPGPDRLMRNGFKDIVDKLAAELKGKILLNHIVTKVDYTDPNAIIVTTKDGQQFQANYVISTLPLGVLKNGSVTFIPQLPQEKIDAMKHLNMGIMNKVVLQFPKVFWDDSEYIEYIPPAYWSGSEWVNKGKWIEFVNMNHYLHKPILIAYMTGDFAKNLENATDQQTISSLMQVLRKIYGAKIPEPKSYIITRWGKDVFSGGSYSSLRPGASYDGQDYVTMAKPVADHLLFAGEATTDVYPSTMYGAYLTGDRAAQYVLDAKKGGI